MNPTTTVVANCDLDIIAKSLASNCVRRDTNADLTDEEKLLYQAAFRAGVTTLFKLSMSASIKGLDDWKDLMMQVAVQVSAWGLPILADYETAKRPDEATVQ